MGSSLRDDASGIDGGGGRGLDAEGDITEDGASAETAGEVENVEQRLRHVFLW
jgi:hypothetical protein